MFGSILGMILYACLGFALSAAGVGIMEKPWQFIVILGLVMAIDLNSRFGG